jgi:hypothetical protein
MGAYSQPLPQEQVSLFGGQGHELIADTSTHTGDWVVIEFLSDTVFASLKGRGLVGTYTGRTFLAGTSMSNGLGYTEIDLASGAILAYPR